MEKVKRQTNSTWGEKKKKHTEKSEGEQKKLRREPTGHVVQELGPG